jgi:outer membrane protein OmpA-like peptidoglycan-associated protein
LIDGTLHPKLQEGVFELKDFQFAEKGKDKKLISISSFSVQGISADLEAREIVVEQVKTADARIESWLGPDGTFKLQSLLVADLQKLMEKKSGAPEPKRTASSPWQATIHKIEVDNWGAAIEDRTLPKPARITVDDFRVRVENLENKKNSKAKVAITFQLNQAGTVKVNGSAGIDPLSADLEVFADKIGLKSFQPYVDTAVNAQIASGNASSKGRILYQGKDRQPQIRYQGELSVDGVEVKDRIQAEDFISQKQLKVSGLVLDLHPNKLHVADVLIHKTHARVTIDQNGAVNVVQAFTPSDKKGEKEKENLIERLVSFLILQIKGPVPMSVDLVKLDHFAVDFIDGSIRPSYTTHLEITEAKMEGMSSDPSARADFKIEGTIDQSATIQSAGQMNPLNARQYAKVDFSLKDFNLEPVSPYSGKYAGYKIAEGTLNLDLKYRVDDDKVIGDNKIIIDQLTLGDKVDSPDATDLPVALGVALLKGSDGRITLQVPVGGNFKDPQADFGQAIKSALMGTMDDVTSSPFSTITAIDGFKGEELRLVEFEFGLSELSEPEAKKLNALAKLLTEKSVLTLGIEGTADRQMDWATMSGKQAKEEKSSSKQKAAKDQAIDDNQLKMLAQMRANSVKDYLIKKGKIAANRVQLKPVKIIPTTQKDHGQVELYLSVQ